MDILDSIKSSIESNTNLDNMTKSKIFELIIIFNNKFPDIKLDKFNELVKTVKLGRISKYESLGTSFYDVTNNEILFSPNRIENIDYDLDNLFMRIILSMITSNGKYSGFNSTPDLRVLNSAYEEILANYIVGCSEVSDQEEEMVITNILANIIGKDKLFEVYFTNNGQQITDILNKLENENMSKFLDEYNRFSEAKLNGTSYKEEYSNIISHELFIADKAIQLKYITNLEILDDIDALVPNSSDGYNSGINFNTNIARENMNILIQKYSNVIENTNQHQVPITKQTNNIMTPPTFVMQK